MVGGYRAQGLVDLLEIQLSEKTDSLLANDLGPLRVLALDSGSLRNLDLLLADEWIMAQHSQHMFTSSCPMRVQI